MWEIFYNKRGFTIVELIVVVATIAVLAAIIISNVNKYAAKARDARRKADMAMVAKAMQMYYADAGVYPRNSGDCADIADPTYGLNGLYPSQRSIPFTKYISKIPQDPKYYMNGRSGVGYTNDYLYNMTGTQSFVLCVNLETETGNSTSRCTTPYNYCLSY
jgi:prepilin-type N-terminal cleavage/methylation domain-containing protein